MCLLANTGEGPVHRNKSLICLPMKTKGVQVVKKLDKLGMRSSDTAQIFLDEVKVPVRNLIGQEGMGFTYQMQQFQEERLWGAISAVVGMERLIDQTIEYTRNRKAFSRPLLDNQIIHFRLAELRTEVEIVRSICYRACEEYIGGNDVTMLASMAKLKAGRMVRQVADGCLQYWGGAGYLWESPTARAFRDTRLASIGGGADEVMLQIICKHMGTLPRLENR
jgi:citronellyl-CoA dehydrogenase